MTQRFGRGSALKAALLMTGSTYVTYALGLIINALIARNVGPTEFGQYSYLVWLSGVLVILANNGLPSSGIRFVAECVGRDDVQSARLVHGWLRVRQWFSLALVCVVFVVALPWFKPAEWAGQLTVLIAVVLVSTVAKTSYLFDTSMGKGYGRFDIEAKSTVAMSLLNTVAVVALVFFKAPVEAYLILFACISVGYGVSAAIMLARGDMRAAHGAMDPTLLQRLKPHVFWTVILLAVYMLSNKTVETFLLNAVVGAKEVGYFAIAAALTRGGVDLLSSGLTTVLMPIMGHAYGSGGAERVKVILSDSVRYFHFLGFLLAGVGLLWADTAITLLYGAQYEPVINVFRVMVVVGGLTLADGAFGAMLSTTDNQRLRASFATFSGVVSAAAAIILVPRYGLAGALIAHASSRVLVFFAAMIAISRVMSVRLPLRELGLLVVAAAVAGAISGALFYLWGNLWVDLIAGVVYAVVFIAMSVQLRAWKQKDGQQLLGLMARFPRVFGRVQPHVSAWVERLPQTD